MPKIIQTTFDVIPEEGFVVRRAYLQNDIKASALVLEAQRRVRKMTVEAEQRAQYLYRETKSAGYAAGMLAAAESLTEYLGACAESEARARQQLRDEVTRVLKYCMSNTDVLVSVFEEVLREKDLSDTAEFNVVFPEEFRLNHFVLKDCLQRHLGKDVSIEYGKDARFVFRFGDHIAEFTPDDFVSQVIGSAMRRIPMIDDEHRAIADECRKRLASLFDAHLLRQPNCNQASSFEVANEDKESAVF